MQIYWIWYALRPGLGDRAKAELLEQYASPEDLYFADASDLARIDQLSAGAMEALCDRDLGPSHKILRQCEDLGIRIVTYGDEAYPQALRQISDPPMVLYYKGELPDFNRQPVIGVVGTRKASLYGLNTARKMGYQLGACGAIVASGMAKGIDASAMKGALTAGGSVVGVLGCGADVVYPKANGWLFADVEDYGCLLTEFPPGMPPMRQNFPRRNRIISGISCGVLVVEAPEKSGALITAQLALDQGRDVFVVPSNIDVPTGSGSNSLLRQGAAPVGCGWDVVGEYAARYPEAVRREELPRSLSDEEPRSQLSVAQEPEKPKKKPAARRAAGKKGIDNREPAPYIDLEKRETPLTGDEKTVYALLEDGKLLTDELIDRSGLAAGKVLTSLTMLQIKGFVRRLPGNFVERTRK